MDQSGLNARSQLPAIITGPPYPLQIDPPSTRRTGALVFALAAGTTVILWASSSDTPTVAENTHASIFDGCRTSSPAFNPETTHRLSVNHSSTSPRQINSTEINALFVRGIDLEATGDLAGARLVLSRAAEAGNARAAFMLAETYDPLELAKLGERGLASNLAAARIWYAKANDLGWKEAAARLERLPKDVAGDH
jgi:hypothetical protein